MGMKTVLVTGATGTLGRRLLAQPDAARHRVRGISRRDGGGDGAPGAAEWMRADLVSGDGLDDAVKGVDVIVHAASDPGGDTWRTDVDGTTRLVASAQRASVGHIIYTSIVGVDRVPVEYYRQKAAAEAIVQGSPVPWTIIRGTQFHDFMDVLCAQMARFRIALVPARFQWQPIDVDEFADAVWGCVADGPRGRVPDVGGPEILTFPEMVRTWMAAQGIEKRILRVPIPGRAAAALRRGAGTAPGRAVGRVTWAKWLREKYRR
jgi:uncharacterized protein YbjT (DUF2867 family)